MVRKLISILSLCALAITPLSTIPSAQADEPIMVFAASSLTDSFTTLGKRFEKLNPGLKVNFSFQSSSVLANQINQGAPADIFVSAEPFVGGENYLVNRVVIAAPINSNIKRAIDLNNKVWLQCAPEVPCGKAATLALVGEGVKTQPVSLEPRASSVLAKLLSGEVDAGIVYRTDVLANSKRLRAIEFKNSKAAATQYQIAQISKSSKVNSLMTFLKSKNALTFLQRKGFEIK